MSVNMLRKQRDRIRNTYHALNDSYPSLMRIVRFIVSGGTATAVNLSTLFLLTHFLNLWYLVSSAIAFILAFFVSFTMQKLWTFGDSSRVHLHSQAITYFFIILVGLAINTTLLYVLVEYARFHYLAAQLVSGVFIAIMNYFSYKRLVFYDRAEKSNVPAHWASRRKFLHASLFIIAIGLFTLAASYRLSENPPTWMDEGSIVQVSINLIENGIYGIQTAPGVVISTDFLTTSFPVIYPIALSFLAFGVNLFSARIIMVLFMGLLCGLAYVLIRDIAVERKHDVALASLFLVVTFSPLYGHGKNVLGEVPGLMFFLASLVLLLLAERNAHLWLWTVAGAVAGLSMATKPIYLFIIAPSAVLVFLIRRTTIPLSSIFAYAVGATAILLAWFFLHVGSIDALKQVLFAANAENAALSVRLVRTSVQFISELQPIYFLVLLGLWWASLVIRWCHAVKIETAELFAGVFSLINLALYLVSRGFYRYFFPAEMLALIFLPLALATAPVKDRYRGLFLKGGAIFIGLLILFQGYQTLFHSWISEHRSSERSALLSEHLHAIPEEKSIFFYNVPEAVLFFPSLNYYQYLHYGDNVIRGEENLPLLFDGAADFVLVDQKFPYTEKINGIYIEIARFDKYVLYERARSVQTTSFQEPELQGGVR